jgi:hypothetical protein
VIGVTISSVLLAFVDQNYSCSCSMGEKCHCQSAGVGDLDLALALDGVIINTLANKQEI